MAAFDAFEAGLPVGMPAVAVAPVVAPIQSQSPVRSVRRRVEDEREKKFDGYDPYAPLAWAVMGWRAVAED